MIGRCRCPTFPPILGSHSFYELIVLLLNASSCLRTRKVELYVAYKNFKNMIFEFIEQVVATRNLMHYQDDRIPQTAHIAQNLRILSQKSNVRRFMLT